MFVLNLIPYSLCLTIQREICPLGQKCLQKEYAWQWPAVPNSLIFQRGKLAESSCIHICIALHWCNYLCSILLKITFSQIMIAFICFLLCMVKIKRFDATENQALTAFQCFWWSISHSSSHYPLK